MNTLCVLLACVTFATDVCVRGTAAQEIANGLGGEAITNATSTMLTTNEALEVTIATLDRKSPSTTKVTTSEVSLTVGTIAAKVTTEIPATSTTTLTSIKPPTENEAMPDRSASDGSPCWYDSYEKITLKGMSSACHPYAVVIRAVFRLNMTFTTDLQNHSLPEFIKHLSTLLSNHIKEVLVKLNLTANSTDVAIRSFRNGSVLAETLIRERTPKLGRTTAALRGELANISVWPRLKFNNQSLSVSLNSTPVFNLCEIDSVCNVSTSVCNFNNMTEQRTCTCRPYHEPVGTSSFRCQLREYTMSKGKVFGIVLVVLLATGILLSILIILHRRPRRTRPSDMMSFASLHNQDSLGELWSAHGGQINEVALTERTTMISTTEDTFENPPHSDEPRMPGYSARRPTPATQVKLYQAANSRRARPGRPAMITCRFEEPRGKRLHSSTPPSVYDIFSKMNDHELARIRQNGCR